jgi:CheY-like chemotaxis protein
MITGIPVMTFKPKGPPPPPATGSQRPPAPLVGSQRPPANVKDALTEARAISGAAATMRSSVAPSIRPAGRKVVVLVDDDPAMRAQLKAALEPFYEVLEAKDGVEAVELAGKIQPPAMFVCDIVMPRLDGFTLAKILKSNPLMKRVPIMFLSSRNSTQDVTQALVLGAVHYFPKSVALSEIVAKIRKIVL